MREKITRYIRAGYAGLYLVSHEETRVEAELKSIATELNHALYAWSVTEGLIDTTNGSVRDCSEPLEVLALAGELPENAILLLRDFHQFLEEPNPVLVRKLKDVIRAARTKGQAIAVLGCRLLFPPELEREIAVVEFALPGHPELRVVMDGILASHNEGKDRRSRLSAPDDKTATALLDAARGMRSSTLSATFSRARAK